MDHSSTNKDFLISKGRVQAYRIPTEAPESDGTLKWNHTDIILVTLSAGEKTGLGYTYANTATARFIKDQLLKLVEGRNALDNSALWAGMVQEIRNMGRPGISSMAIAAVDNALWDLKAKLLELPLCKLLGQVHESVAAYASGGFTSYPPQELSENFGEWRSKGFRMFKMKIGRNKGEDFKRLESARSAIGDSQLFVDANGAYYPQQAVAMAEEMAVYDVQWYEEPVTSDNLEGLRLVREKLPARVNVAAGEYGFSLTYFRRMLAAGSVDVLQADATRCAGITGFIKAHSLCEAYHLPFSAHCAPSLHLHPALALKNLVHIEYFHDHVRLEQMLFDGAARAIGGKLHADLSQPGLGLEFRYSDAEKYQLNY